MRQPWCSENRDVYATTDRCLTVRLPRWRAYSRRRPIMHRIDNANAQRGLTASAAFRAQKQLRSLATRFFPPINSRAPRFLRVGPSFFSVLRSRGAGAVRTCTAALTALAGGAPRSGAQSRRMSSAIGGVLRLCLGSGDRVRRGSQEWRDDATYTLAAALVDWPSGVRKPILPRSFGPH
jgi:hypothetical protein